MRRVIDRDLVSALVLFVIGGVAMSAMGTDMRNWIFPRVTTYLILLVGMVLAGRVVLGPVIKRVPDLLQASRDDLGIFIDVLVFCAIVFIFILAVNGLGFWLSSFLMLSLASIYLTPQKTPYNIAIAIVVSLAACVVAYILFLHVFYVPLPEAGWWPGGD